MPHLTLVKGATVQPPDPVSPPGSRWIVIACGLCARHLFGKDTDEAGKRWYEHRIEKHPAAPQGAA